MRNIAIQKLINFHGTSENCSTYIKICCANLTSYYYNSFIISYHHTLHLLLKRDVAEHIFWMIDEKM